MNDILSNDKNFKMQVIDILKLNRELWDKNNKLKAMLLDFFPNYKAVRHVLYTVYDEGFVERIKHASNENEINAVSAIYIDILCDDYGIEKTIAEWAVSVWLNACGKNINNCSLYEDKQVLMKYKKSNYMPLFFEPEIFKEKIVIYEEDYRQLLNAVISSADNYKARNSLVELLCKSLMSEIEDYEFRYNLSEQVIIENKRICLELLIELMSYYTNEKPRTNQQKQMYFISKLFVASCNFMLGKYSSSLSDYFEALDIMLISSDLYEDYNQFETALRILKNISKIYEILGLLDRKKLLYEKHYRLIEAENMKLLHRLTYNKDIEFVIKQKDILCNTYETNNIFFNFPIGYFHGVGSLWDEGFRNPNKPSKEFFDQFFRVEVENGSVSFMEAMGEHYTAIFKHDISEDERRFVKKLKSEEALVDLNEILRMPLIIED